MSTNRSKTPQASSSATPPSSTDPVSEPTVEVKVVEAESKVIDVDSLTLSDQDTLEDFVLLFNGKDSIAGTGVGFEMMKTFLKDHPKRKIHACMVFYEKPIAFLSQGKAKKNKGDGKKLTKRVLEYLPLHSEEELKKMGDRNSNDKFGEFSKVNMTMVRRVALYAAEKKLENIPIVKSWLLKYGGVPSSLKADSKCFAKMNDKTKEIKLDGILKFVSEEPFWKNTNIKVP